MTDGSALSATKVIPGGFWRRWSARFVDQLILIGICVVVLILTSRVDATTYPSSEAVRTGKRVLEIGYLVLAALYFASTESSAMQASPGKRLFGIKVVDSQGARISFFRALSRWFAASLSWLSLGIGFFMAGAGSKRALHDFASSTQVVDRWAFSAFPERQHSPTVGQQAFGFATVLLVFLAFIASSQYSDYVLRSQVSEGISLADSIKTAMESHLREHGSWPTSNAQLGLGVVSGEYVGQIDIGNQPGQIEITYSSKPPQRVHQKLNGRHLYIDGRLENGEVRWTCHSEDLRQGDCPSSCRCSW